MVWGLPYRRHSCHALVTPMRNYLKALCLPAICGFLFCASPAAGATIISISGADTSTFDDGAEDLPAADLTGWFLTFDPSDQWTSAANIATMESWLAAAEELSAEPTGTLDTSLAPAVQPGLTDTALVPEPATLGLLGLALATLYAGI